MGELRNLVSVSDMTRQWWDGLYLRCCDIIADPGNYADSCRGKLLASLFYEPSTRTNFSFQAAMMRLGGNVFGFSDPMCSSVSKGETLVDTVRITATYSDAIVIRSSQEGAPTAAALYSETPIINAGDGGHFHPTQTLTDLATIAQKRGGIGDFSIGICGDLKYGRTVHSLIVALALFPDVRFYLISPRELRIPEYVRQVMQTNELQYSETENLAQCIPDLDILYMTRVQRERFGNAAEYKRLRGVYVLTRKLLERARGDMLIMHPLPRYGEITPEVDSDPRAIYFEQARYGMYIRMALLHELTHLPRRPPPPVTGVVSALKCRNPACVTQTELYLPPIISARDTERCGYCDKNFLSF